MPSTILVVAPHADDETLGCAGTLLKHRAAGNAVHWVIATSISELPGVTPETLQTRANEIQQVAKAYDFRAVHELNFPTTQLDAIPMGKIVQAIGGIVKRIEPDTIYLPNPGDIHSDHKVVCDAVLSCSKWFRYPSIREMLIYETLSETEMALSPERRPFRPNVWVNISDHLDRKLEIMAMYKSEFGEFPFPRSETAIRAQAALRGSQMGQTAAEAFCLLKSLRQ